ncbi:peptidase C19 family protein [Tieghemostelium lacteum]|uniref:Ubiquitin carboxyl-terminal hydrolase n=1 Tax=Tieghemostelium lacteum TaxID=361077 RepID=A0A152A1E0_TIELA|nr:peptidase C19 family protein [Tieghemostelium lacteum]|eukprot:KYR00024.1 peptidase C19 family protein [Tieghemostelium lacteum]
MGNIISSSKLEKELSNHHQLPIHEKFYGLENFGNTCYCNSVLQALFYCQPFRDNVIKYYNNHLKEIQNQSSAPPGMIQASSAYIGYWKSSTRVYQDKEDTLILCLGDLFYTITQQKKQTGVIAPKRFVERLKFENELFRSYMHQDAHEFLNFLLNSIAELLQKQIKEKQNRKQKLNSNSSSTNIDESAEATNKENEKKKQQESTKTFIHEIFEGILTNETKCLTCESITNKDESFLDLSIDIEQHRSLNSCLSNFSSVEVLSKNDKFFCDKCNSLQEAQKRMKIKKLPNTLIIHLKRFKFIESIQQYKKLNDRVVFPFEIIIQNTTHDIENPDKKFYLFAVTIHVGSGPNHGHYVSLIKSNGIWFRFDDDNIDIISENDIYNCFGNNHYGSNECGYLLFYQSYKQEVE